MGLIITLIVGLAAISIFTLSEFKNWLERYNDSKDEK